MKPITSKNRRKKARDPNQFVVLGPVAPLETPEAEPKIVIPTSSDSAEAEDDGPSLPSFEKPEKREDAEVPESEKDPDFGNAA